MSDTDTDPKPKPRLPKKPPEGLLHSMAIRYDHGLACPGYYDQEIFKKCAGGEFGHKQRYDSTISAMGQLYEEVSGHGFYRWPASDVPPANPSPPDEEFR